MKLQIFKPAVITLMVVFALAQTGMAQQTQGGEASLTPAPPATPPAPPAYTSVYTPYVSLAPASTLWVQGTQDTTYRKKMEKLREQMRQLQKEMGELSKEQYKKSALAAAEYSKKLNEKFKADFNKNFEFKFNEKFNKDFSKNFYFPADDKSIKEMIQNGELKEKAKTYTKSYNVDKDDVLQIENRYGKIVVNTWTKNEFKVDVQIKAVANDEGDAQKLLDDIKISDSKDASTVAFKTNIEQNDRNQSWGTIFTKGKKYVRKIEVNYTVYMPAKNALTITNRFGSTQLPDLTGRVVIDNSYGSLIAKSLTHPGNDIKVRFGSASIENLKGSELDVAYGSLNLGTVDKLNADLSFGAAKIGKINTQGTINVKYGSGLQITDVDKNIKGLSVNSQFASVKLGVAAAQNANFDVTVRNGSFDYEGNTVNVVSKTPQDDSRSPHFTKTFKGTLGKGDADKVIVVKTSYGSVKFD